MTNPAKFCRSAAWYRGFAERARNPTIWKARLRTAKQLEVDADRADPKNVSTPLAEDHD